MIELTRAEEQVMQVLWKLERAFVKDILDELPRPRPAYNTISTIIRILEKKEVVSYEAFGKSHRYYPLISKEEYSRQQLTSIVSNYFEGSFNNMVSFFANQKKMNVKELDEMLEMIRQLKNKK